nr:SpoIIE family protein phosphatase [Streptomyces antibioticus]
MTARIPAGLDGILRTASTAGRATLESLVSRPRVGLAVWDTDLRCVWVNGTLGRQDGIPAPRRQGRRPSRALRGDADALETVMERVLADGAPVIGREYRVPAAGGRPERVLSVSFFRLDDADGRPLGVCSLVQDPAGRRWTGRCLALLSDAATRIGTTLDVMRTGQELADFAVPFLADYVTVELTEAVRLGAEPLDRLGPTGGRVPVFRRAGLASVRPGAPESLWNRGEAVYVAAASPFTQVLSSGCSLLEPDLAGSTRARLDLDPARAEKIRAYGMHSLMVVPMHARGILLGVAVFVRGGNPAPFDEEDLLLAEELVRRAALSLDNARRYTRERAAALALQRTLLPHRVTGGAALDVVTRYLPADAEDGVGGDWFDVIPLPGARVALVVGDVVGHGLDAAATMGRLRMAVRTLAEVDLPPDELLNHLNEVVGRLAQEDPAEEQSASSVGATCLYAVYDPVTRACAMARAGHPPPAILQPDGKVVLPDVPAGTPLGLATLPYESTELELPEGSVIALFSDGLIEDRRHDIDEGIDRLSAHLARRHPGGTVPRPDRHPAGHEALRRRHAPPRPHPLTPLPRHRLVGTARRRVRRRNSAFPGSPAAGPVGAGEADGDHRTPRQRTGHQRRPPRRRSHPPEHDPPSGTGLRGHRRQHRRTTPAPRPPLRRERPRPVPRSATGRPVGQPPHARRQARLGRTGRPRGVRHRAPTAPDR